MTSIALQVSEDFKGMINKLPWINWSEIAREEILEEEKRLKRLKEIDELLKNSELTDEDILAFSKKARSGRFKQLKAKGLL